MFLLYKEASGINGRLNVRIEEAKMSVEELARFVPPPAMPNHAGSQAERAEIESKLGTRLPNDLYAFIETYGTGEIQTVLRC